MQKECSSLPPATSIFRDLPLHYDSSCPSFRPSKAWAAWASATIAFSVPLPAITSEFRLLVFKIFLVNPGGNLSIIRKKIQTQ